MFGAFKNTSRLFPIAMKPYREGCLFADSKITKLTHSYVLMKSLESFDSFLTSVRPAGSFVKSNRLSTYFDHPVN